MSMRIVVDDQLPIALARWITAQSVIAWHVCEIGLAGRPDAEIWAYAKREAATIVSMDSDFRDLQNADPVGPAVIWLQWGNTRTAALLAKFAAEWPSILVQLGQGQRLIGLQ